MTFLQKNNYFGAPSKTYDPNHDQLRRNDRLVSYNPSKLPLADYRVISPNSIIIWRQFVSDVLHLTSESIDANKFKFLKPKEIF